MNGNHVILFWCTIHLVIYHWFFPKVHISTSSIKLFFKSDYRVIQLTIIKTTTKIVAHISLNFWTLKLFFFVFFQIEYEPLHEISNNVVCVTRKDSDQPPHMRSLNRAFVNRLNTMSVKLLTEHHLEFLSLKGGGGATQARPSVHLSKYHIVGNHISVKALIWFISSCPCWDIDCVI